MMSGHAMCGQAKQWIAASWTGELDAAQEMRLKQHLEICPACAAEMSELGELWEKLAELPAAEPSAALAVRWEATLESLGASVEKARGPKQWRFTLAALWPQRPVWQVAIALACLVVGLTVGSLRKNAGNSEIATLREEVANTKAMVALSLLQQQSATERLRGVDYSVRLPGMEPEVVAALLEAVNHDSNVNVRLAAIDALSKASGNPRVRASMAQSLGQQESPMVQAALIDYMVDTKDQTAVGTLRQFADRPDLNPSVRQRADQAMRQLTEYR